MQWSENVRISSGVFIRGMRRVPAPGLAKAARNCLRQAFVPARRVMFSPLCLSIKIIAFKIINVLDGGTDPGWLSARLRVAARCALALAEPGGFCLLAAGRGVVTGPSLCLTPSSESQAGRAAAVLLHLITAN